MISNRVRAFCAPFNVANDYGEIILTGAWDHWLSHHKPPFKLPMWLMHDEKEIIGAWDKIWVDSTGLWAEGEVTSARGWRMIQTKDKELSIDYFEPWRSDQSLIRTASQIQDNRHVSFSEALGAATYGLLFHKTVGNGLFARHIVEQTHVKEAGLREISFVTGGSFKGTHYEVL